MCTLRALFVISEGGDIVLSRRYHSVEKLAKQIYGEHYIPVQPDWEFKQLYLDEFSKQSTSCETKTNAFEAIRAQAILTLQEKLWPVVYMNSIGLYLVAVPLIEGVILHTPSPSSSFHSIEFYQQQPLADLPFITTTMAFLDTFVQFVEPCAPRFELEKIAELQTLLSRMVQFGRPIETNLQNVIALNKTEYPPNDTTEARPGWKPVLSVFPKVTPRVEFQLIETISAVQYDHPKLVSDTWHVNGALMTRVDLDANVVLTLPLNRAAPSSGTASNSPNEIKDARYHPCVTSPPWTTYPLITTFQPPLGQFCLANYSVSLPKLPIRGFYQLRDTGTASSAAPTASTSTAPTVPVSLQVFKMLIQLKLSDYLPNAFDYCDVEIPFPTKREIVSFDLVPTCGTVTVHPKKRNVLIWSLGTRFTGRNLEVNMPGSITFDSASILETSDNPFCVLPNAYIELRFRIPDTSLAGLLIDTKQISINPKPNTLKSISCERYLISDKYIIWNSCGNVLHPTPPDDANPTQ
jgi:hypothetical protein